MAIEVPPLLGENDAIWDFPYHACSSSHHSLFASSVSPTLPTSRTSFCWSRFRCGGCIKWLEVIFLEDAVHLGCIVAGGLPNTGSRKRGVNDAQPTVTLK